MQRILFHKISFHKISFFCQAGVWSAEKESNLEGAIQRVWKNPMRLSSLIWIIWKLTRQPSPPEQTPSAFANPPHFSPYWTKVYSCRKLTNMIFWSDERVNQPLESIEDRSHKDQVEAGRRNKNSCFFCQHQRSGNQLRSNQLDLKLSRLGHLEVQ